MVCSNNLTLRIMQAYCGDAPAENMSEILSELQKFWEVLNYFCLWEQAVLSG